MELRLVQAALQRERGTVLLAVIAVAIGTSVACALLQVSGEVSRKLSHELRALGPNFLVVPRGAAGAASDRTAPPARFLERAVVDARLREIGLPATPMLYAVARIHGLPVTVVGTDLAAAVKLHPAWQVKPGAEGSLVGTRLLARLGLSEGQTVVLEFAGGQRSSQRVGAALEAGTADDEAWWLPIELVQELTGHPGQASLYQARIDGGIERAERMARAIERDDALRAIPLRALSTTEAGLLERMRRLMTLVTLAALIAAGLAAFGTLTDLALERRREIALMKALGAGRRDVVRQFAAEALAIGMAGGIAGWLIGLVMSQVIGREVFHSPIAVVWSVLPTVLGLSLAVSALASLGPIRLALAVEPAVALKGD